MMEIRIFKCKICGSIVVLLEGETNSLTCCGTLMERVNASYDDSIVDQVSSMKITGYNEKHLPVVKVNNRKIHIVVGELEHPMTLKHHIDWIIIQTNLGFKIIYLEVDGKPSTYIKLNRGEKLLRVYSYCNIHGLWVKNIEE